MKFVSSPFLPVSEQIAFLRDFTLLKRAELKLTHASEQFRYLIDNSPDGIFVESSDGVVLDANAVSCELRKISRDQLIGQDVLTLVPHENRASASTRSSSLVSENFGVRISKSAERLQIVDVGV